MDDEQKLVADDEENTKNNDNIGKQDATNELEEERKIRD